MVAEAARDQRAVIFCAAGQRITGIPDQPGQINRQCRIKLPTQQRSQRRVQLHPSNIAKAEFVQIERAVDPRHDLQLRQQEQQAPILTQGDFHTRNRIIQLRIGPRQ